MPEIFTSPNTSENKVRELPKNEHPALINGSVGLFSTFSHMPKGIYLAEQEEDEEIILLLRRDFITNLPWIATTLILFVLPLPIFGIIQTLNITLVSFSLSFLLLLACFYYIIAIGFAFINFISWFYNLGIVTSRRVLRIIFSNLSTISVAAADLTDVVDVEFSQHGFSQSVFDFGDIMLQTETRKQNFDFEQIPRPAQVVEIISKLTGER